MLKLLKKSKSAIFTYRQDAAKKSEHRKSKIIVENSNNCALCTDNKKDYILLSCGHMFHASCLIQIVLDESEKRGAKCTECNKQMEVDECMFVCNKYSIVTKLLYDEICDRVDSIEKDIKALRDDLLDTKIKLNKLENKKSISMQLVSAIKVAELQQFNR